MKGRGRRIVEIAKRATCKTSNRVPFFWRRTCVPGPCSGALGPSRPRVAPGVLRHVRVVAAPSLGARTPQRVWCEASYSELGAHLVPECSDGPPCARQSAALSRSLPRLLVGPRVRGLETGERLGFRRAVASEVGASRQLCTPTRARSRRSTLGTAHRPWPKTQGFVYCCPLLPFLLLRGCPDSVTTDSRVSETGERLGSFSRCHYTAS